MQTGNDLKQARIALGWSQRELARRAGIDRKAVSYWEARPVLDGKGYATGKMVAVLGGEFLDQYARGESSQEKRARQRQPRPQLPNY